MGRYSDMLLAPEAPPAPQAGKYSQALGLASAAEEQITPLSESAMGAGLGTIAGASMIDDPKARAKYFAAKRGISADRYRVVGNDVLYKADDGKYYREVPEMAFRDPQTLAQRAAAGVGPAIPAAAGAAAGIATAPAMLAGPLGLAGSMAATGGAAAGGEVLKDVIGSALAGQSQMDVSSPAMQAATAGLGQGIGAGIGALMNRGAARDIARLDRGAAAQLGRQAEAVDIPLTPAEQTGMRSLRGQQTLLGNIPRSGEVMDDFYRGRAERIENAVGNYLQRISPQDSGEIAGERIRAAAEGAREGLRTARTAAASPSYEYARRSGAVVDTSDALAYIDQRLPEAKGGIRASLERLRRLLLDQGRPDMRVGPLHEAKIEMDRMLRQGSVDPASAEAFIRRDLQEVQGRLTRALSTASPQYDAGRRAFAAASEPLDALETGLVGNILRLPEGNARQAAIKLFSPTSSGPRAVMNARAILQRADPEAWQGIKRAYLEHVWQGASSQKAIQEAAPDLGGAAWRRALLGDRKQAAILRSALNADEWQALNDLGDVLEATGSVVRRNSHTAYQQEAMAELRSRAGGVMTGAMRGLDVTAPLRGVANWLDRVRLGGHAERQAEIITSPDAMRQLRALRQLSPRSQRFITAVSQFATRWGLDEGSEVLSPPGVPETIPPGPLQ